MKDWESSNSKDYFTEFEERSETAVSENEILQMHRKPALFRPPISWRRGNDAAGFFQYLLPYPKHDLLENQPQKSGNILSEIVGEIGRDFLSQWDQRKREIRVRWRV